jgi:hypothetical protein
MAMITLSSIRPPPDEHDDRSGLEESALTDHRWLIRYWV